MVVKINHKPILVEENEDEKDFSWIYMLVSSVGYMLCFWVLDYCCFIFMGTHPFTFISWLTSVFKWFGGIF